MPDILLIAVAALGGLLAGVVLAALLVRGRSGGAEPGQLIEAARAEAEATRARLADAERALSARAEQGRVEAQAAFGALTTALVREQGEARALLEAKLREMGEQSAGSLSAIRRAVEEQLHHSVERQMTASFQRVADQVAGLQRAMGDIQAVASQVGDLKRLFGNVKARGGWGESQLRALLDDHLPAGAYETNRKLREDSDDLVEFAIRSPPASIPAPCSPSMRSSRPRTTSACCWRARPATGMASARPGARWSSACGTRPARSPPSTSARPPRSSSPSCTCRPTASTWRPRACPA